MSVQRFLGSLTTGYWPDNPEPLVRDDLGDFVKFEDYLALQAELEAADAAIKVHMGKHAEILTEANKRAEEAEDLLHGANQAIKTRNDWLAAKDAELAEAREQLNKTRLPKEPPEGLLKSMAIRSDHGLGVLGYYDGPMFSGHRLTHEERLEAAIRDMRQLYEEVSGHGFYNWPVPTPEDETE